MRVIADLHIHSKYSRATSPQMEVDTLAVWARKKGIDLIATGDVVHPVYLKELKENLVDDGSGFFHLKGRQGNPEGQDIKFVLSGEISCIYKQGDKARRIHVLIFAPDFTTIDKIVKKLEDRKCNLRSDGRPIIGLSVKDLAQICFEANERCMVIPAHVWTPWFAVFGSKSGFDSIEECFEELTPEIFSLETGLSSDPEMNWRLSALDQITLISNSDAHSPLMLGREANVFEFEDFTYNELRQTLKNKDLKKFLYTIEFYPQEGKYHLDGHRDCKVFFTPQESLKQKNICPVCKKSLVLGVDHRVEALADRELGFKPKNQIPYKSIIPLYELIAECFGVGVKSKKVMALYEKMLDQGGNEFKVLLELEKKQLEEISTPLVAEAVMRMRAGKVYKQAGYDGVFGLIKVFTDDELAKLRPTQHELF